MHLVGFLSSYFLNDFSNYRVFENCPLLGYYEARRDNSLLMFWNNLPVPSSRVPRAWCVINQKSTVLTVSRWKPEIIHTRYLILGTLKNTSKMELMPHQQGATNYKEKSCNPGARNFSKIPTTNSKLYVSEGWHAASFNTKDPKILGPTVTIFSYKGSVHPAAIHSPQCGCFLQSKSPTSRCYAILNVCDRCRPER